MSIFKNIGTNKTLLLELVLIAMWYKNFSIFNIRIKIQILI